MHYGREFLSVAMWDSEKAQHLRETCARVSCSQPQYMMSVLTVYTSPLTDSQQLGNGFWLKQSHLSSSFPIIDTKNTSIRHCLSLSHLLTLYLSLSEHFASYFLSNRSRTPITRYIHL